MLCDQNKTELGRFVTVAAVRWMTEHGFKPVETEVGVAPGWVADVAGAICPTPTEAIALKLMPRKPRGWGEARDKWDAEFLAIPEPLIGVVEVKTSRGDFMRDRKWNMSPVADLNYLAMCPGVAEVDEVPSIWGVIECKGEAARMVRPAQRMTTSLQQRLDVVLAVAMRRDNATRYERLRAITKAQRQEDNGYVNRRRVSDCLRAVLDVFHGKRTPEEAIGYARIHPSYVKDSLEELKLIHGLGPKLGIERTKAEQWI